MPTAAPPRVSTTSLRTEPPAVSPGGSTTSCSSALSRRRRRVSTTRRRRRGLRTVRDALVDHAAAHGYRIAAAGLHPPPSGANSTTRPNPGIRRNSTGFSTRNTGTRPPVSTSTSASTTRTRPSGSPTNSAGISRRSSRSLRTLPSGTASTPVSPPPAPRCSRTSRTPACRPPSTIRRLPAYERGCSKPGASTTAASTVRRAAPLRPRHVEVGPRTGRPTRTGYGLRRVRPRTRCRPR